MVTKQSLWQAFKNMATFGKAAKDEPEAASSAEAGPGHADEHAQEPEGAQRDVGEAG